MTDIILKLIDIASNLVPLRFVRPWERALYLVAGRFWKVVGPGPQLVMPGLCEVIRVSVVPEVYTTPLQSITLRDGTSLTFSASITVVVTDPHAAWCNVGHYTETVTETAAALLAEELRGEETKKLEPERGKRGRTMDRLRDQLNAEVGRFGVEVTALRFNNYVRGVRTIRLLTDRAVLGG